MIISFIGMSGSGKTFWSKKLAESGFKRFCCDDLIEEMLSGELKKLGYSGIADVSRWMGQPYENKYHKSSIEYLECEEKVVMEIIALVSKLKDKVVIDTTGSVIYINPKLLKKLKQLSKVIYLEVPKEVKDEMYNLYLLDPKPVIWGSSFNKKGKETNFQAIKRCYPELLNYRAQKYQKLADSTLNYFKLRDEKFGLSQLIELINQ